MFAGVIILSFISNKMIIEKEIITTRCIVDLSIEKKVIRYIFWNECNDNPTKRTLLFLTFNVQQ